MRSLVWLLLGLGVLAVALPEVRADLRPGGRPPPLPAKPNTVPFVIVIDDKAKEPHLEIPRPLLAALRASVDVEDETRRAEATPRLHSIFAGVALALALAATGFWLVRSGNRFSRTGVAVLLTAGTLLTAGGLTLWANIPAPPPPQPQPPLPPGLQTDRIVVDFLPRGNAIRLLVSSKQLQDVLDQSAPKKGPAQPGAAPKPR